MCLLSCDRPLQCSVDISITTLSLDVDVLPCQDPVHIDLTVAATGIATVHESITGDQKIPIPGLAYKIAGVGAGVELEIDIGAIVNAMLPLTIRFVACVDIIVHECVTLATVLNQEGIPVPASTCPSPSPSPPGPVHTTTTTGGERPFTTPPTTAPGPNTPQIPGGSSNTATIVIASTVSVCVAIVVVVAVVVMVVLPRRRRTQGYRLVSHR